MKRPKKKPSGLVAVRQGAAALAREALGRANALETLESAYLAWADLEQARRDARAERERRRQRLEDQGAFMVGAVRAAGAPQEAGPALVRRDEGIDRLLREAESKLSKARAELDGSQAEAESILGKASGELKALIADRIERYARKAKPHLKLFLRPAGKDRAILHLQRVGPDEAVLLLWALSGRVPSRYGYLFDDSVEQMGLPAAALYPDEGIPLDAVRPSAARLAEELATRTEVWPVKAFVPVMVPTPPGHALYRMLERGPVMEVEIAEGDNFRHVLTQDEGQRFAGYLMRQKLEGRIELDLEAG